MLIRVSDNDEYDDVDMDAFRRALEIASRDPLRAEQLKSKLEDEPWAQVARFAAYVCQCQALGLTPWQSPPCHAHGQASLDLLDELLDAGLSQWEPDPAAALREAKRRK